MKIAVFLPNWIGDAVMATPALRAVREQFAGAEIVGVLRPYVAEVLAGLDLVDRCIVHDPSGRSTSVGNALCGVPRLVADRGTPQRAFPTGSPAGPSFPLALFAERAGASGNACPTSRGWRFVRRLRRERLDLALLLPNSLRSAWLAWLSGARRRVGFDRDGRGLLLTDRVPPKPNREPHPVIDEYLRLAAHLGCQRLSRTMELAVLPADERRLDEFWAAQGHALRDRGVVCLNPGGAFGSAKHWPAESFGELARRIAGELGKTVLVLCGPAERDEARRIVRHAGHPRVVTLADVPLGLGLTKAAIRDCDLLVTTDSGPRHFAPPFGVPVVTLFGPTHIAWSETFAPKTVHLQLEMDCGPCQQRTCPLGHHRCMRDLTVERVFAAVVSQLARRAVGVSPPTPVGVPGGPLRRSAG